MFSNNSEKIKELEAQLKSQQELIKQLQQSVASLTVGQDQTAAQISKLADSFTKVYNDIDDIKSKIYGPSNLGAAFRGRKNRI